MADQSRIYKVSVRRTTGLQSVWRISLFFGTMTLWIGLSHVWFGGSWVIDLFAAVTAILSLFVLKSRIGDSVTMTSTELRSWLDAGCPDTWGQS